MICEKLIDKLNYLPEQRIDCIESAFENSPNAIRKVINEYHSGCTIKDTRTLILNGELVKESSGFCESDNTIYMNEEMDNDLYSDVFRHEFGHYIDSKLSRISLSENFKYALQADRDWYNLSTDNGVSFFNAMLEDLSESDVLYSAYISDILSAMFYNDTKIQKTYLQNGAMYSHHRTKYWLGEENNAPANAVQREVFANLFAICSENNLENICFIKKWFPNLLHRFKTEIEKRLNYE